MFREHTLFVIGAGASWEVGIPLGTDLRQIVGEYVDIRYDGYQQISGNPNVMAALRLHWENDGRQGDLNRYLHAGWRLRDTLLQASSVDSALDAHPDEEVVLCGKLAIVRSIWDKEDLCPLKLDHQDPRAVLPFSDYRLSWLKSFVEMLVRGYRQENLDQLFERVSIVVFNYDRCFEHYLFHALRGYFAIQDVEATAIISRLRLFHAYGSAGTLPWQRGTTPATFGGSKNEKDLLAAAKGIHTFTEQKADDTELAEIRDLVENCETLIFLGFGFQLENLRLLRPQRPSAAKRVLLTTKGIADSESDVVRDEIVHHLLKEPDQIEFFWKRQMTCTDFFGEYRRILEGR